MIEPVELTIDDWVKVEQTTETVTARVLGIHKDGVINYEVDYSGVRATNQIHADYVSPIGLTEDVLVKNRFALDKTLAEIGVKVYTRPCPAGDLSVKVFHDGSIRFGFIKLTYVHQLQHLLRLAGVEKEVEL
jgi:hypothetical protein